MENKGGVKVTVSNCFVIINIYEVLYQWCELQGFLSLGFPTWDYYQC